MENHLLNDSASQVLYYDYGITWHKYHINFSVNNVKRHLLILQKEIDRKSSKIKRSSSIVFITCLLLLTNLFLSILWFRKW